MIQPIRTLLVSYVVCVVVSAVSVASAQSIRVSQNSPTQLAGLAFGQASLSDSGPGCRGYGQRQPSHMLQVTEFWDAMQIAINAPQDTTLVVQLANGQIVCDDDSGGGSNPLITVPAQPGVMRIWVGTYSQGERSPYSITIGSVGRVRPDQAQLNPNAPSRFAGAELQSGFQPQILVLRGQYGGMASASRYSGGCTGYTESGPSHLLTLRSGFRNLRFVVNGEGGDTTLVVQYPDGRIVCQDDTEGNNPVVEGASGPGVVRIWVGSFSVRESGNYRMAVTEQPLRADQVPMDSVQFGQQQIVVAPVPGVAPVGVAPAPTLRASTAIELLPRIPVTVFGPDIPEATLALWSPRTGEAIEVGIRRNGNGIVISGTVNGQPLTINAEIPPGFEQAVVSVTERPDGRLLVRAENFAGGQSALFLLDWQQGAVEIDERWAGALRARAPRWAR